MRGTGEEVCQRMRHIMRRAGGAGCRGEGGTGLCGVVGKR